MASHCARPPVPGAVGECCPVAAGVGLAGGMGREGVSCLGGLAIHGRGRRRGLNNLGRARLVTSRCDGAPGRG